MVVVIDFREWPAPFHPKERYFERTHLAGGRNQSLPNTNTSGQIGVFRAKTDGKWIAAIKVNQRNIHLGTFDSFEEACSARKAAELKYGFHKRHGEYRA